MKDPCVIFELIDVIHQCLNIEAGGGEVSETVDIALCPEFIDEKLKD